MAQVFFEKARGRHAQVRPTVGRPFGLAEIVLMHNRKDSGDPSLRLKNGCAQDDVASLFAVNCLGSDAKNGLRMRQDIPRSDS